MTRKWDKLGKLGKEFNLLSGGREGFSCIWEVISSKGDGKGKEKEKKGNLFLGKVHLEKKLRK